MTITNVSLNPANNDTLEGAFKHILNKMIESVDGMLPARVVAYDRTTNRATVQPLINLVSTDGSSINRAQINNIPVLLLGGGGYLISFPLNPGDLGWVMASDRDISLFTQNYENANPNTFRKKDFADSVFIPDAMTGYSFDGSDSSNLVIQSLNGDTKISIGSSEIKISAPTINLDQDVNISGNLIVDGDLTVNGNFVGNNGADITGNVNITGDLDVTGTITGGGGATITGDLAVIGNITATGSITPNV